ncbi:unnamed protein product [marine sediment metagenome]|uniref:Uncharacterized protein n=1 Tax=marine sediment metagenome TaxID=412755 RepID=X1C698_9ZZZZ
MSCTVTKGKFPKKPKDGTVLEACRKDFRNFKKDNGRRVMEFISFQVTQNSLMRKNNDAINEQEDNLEMVRTLIKEGREDVAFSLLFRTFPSCLPHRSRNFFL